jgi:hypothetical protein
MRLFGWIGLAIAAAGIVAANRRFEPTGPSALSDGIFYWFVVYPMIVGAVAGLIFGLIIRWGLTYEPYRDA